MGRIVIIKGADFSVNACDTVEYYDVEQIDFSKLTKTNNTRISSDKWATNGSCYLIPVVEGDSFIINGNGNNNAAFAQVKLSNGPESIVIDDDVVYGTGISGVTTVAADDENIRINIPSECTHLYINNVSAGVSHLCGSLYKIIVE